MKQKLTSLPVVFLLIVLAIAGFSARTYTIQSPSVTPSPKAAATAVLETSYGSTDGITFFGILILMVIILAIAARLKELRPG